METIGESYPNGPCKLPLKCTCGFIITTENVISVSCTDDCDICEYCGNDRCPACNVHIHCGGCV